MKIQDYEVHPAAKLFPMLPKDELKELADDIKAHGLIHPIIVFNKAILDGRNRLVACGMAGVRPRFEKYSGEHSPVEYVLATNLRRRQLSLEQRIAVGVDSLPMLEEEARERQAHGKTAPGKTLTEKIPEASGEAREKAAELVGVNSHYISDGKRLKEESPETFEAMRSGEITMAAARKKLKRKPKKRGTYEAWTQFRNVCKTLDKSLDELSELSVDSDHVIPARDLAEKLSRKLTSIIKKIGE